MHRKNNVKIGKMKFACEKKYNLCAKCEIMKNKLCKNVQKRWCAMWYEANDSKSLFQNLTKSNEKLYLYCFLCLGMVLAS